jgi:hypothetical protein
VQNGSVTVQNGSVTVQNGTITVQYGSVTNCPDINSVSTFKVKNRSKTKTLRPKYEFRAPCKFYTHQRPELMTAEDIYL